MHKKPICSSSSRCFRGGGRRGGSPWKPHIH
ncbi:unnamed protein product [Spirodela intermedia]|uniref:Uncharacterized protein n=1 Tax=Spirodela intermedia TaxID=51605 RepID=A0ABN7E9Y0_SPIIN|nr:unnamed protein product [Spirodela intermedia]